MSVRQRKKLAKAAHDCPTCGTHFKGTYCPTCGEKVFHVHDLSIAHLTEHTIDLFTHFDLKIPKSLGLLFRGGYLTSQFLKGIRVPYAKPVQIFLIVNILFFFAVKQFGFNDFTPVFGDHNFFLISDSYGFGTFLKPLENRLVTSTDNWGALKAFEMGSIAAPDPNLIYGEHYYDLTFTDAFYKASKLYSKTLIFLLVPLVALFSFALLFRKFKYFGASFIFSVHFVSYYLLAFCVWKVLFHYLHLEPMVLSVDWFFFRTALKPISEFFFLGKFELIQLCIMVPWLFFAFKKLFQLKWYINFPLAYLFGRVVFFLTFGVYKKILIATVLWLM